MLAELDALGLMDAERLQQWLPANFKRFGVVPRRLSVRAGRTFQRRHSNTPQHHQKERCPAEPLVVGPHSLEIGPTRTYMFSVVTKKDNLAKEESPMCIAKRAVVGVAVMCLLCLAAAPASAQEWSPAQKEVWKNVETYWDLVAKGDLEGFLSYMHPDYRGWSYQSPVPETKETARKFLTYELANSKTVVYQITPVAIQVHGDVALVAYYYTEITTDAEGKTTSRQGRWLDVLMRQGDRWVMIGDHGGDQS